MSFLQCQDAFAETNEVEKTSLAPIPCLVELAEPVLKFPCSTASGTDTFDDEPSCPSYPESGDFSSIQEAGIRTPSSCGSVIDPNDAALQLEYFSPEENIHYGASTQFAMISHFHASSEYTSDFMGMCSEGVRSERDDENQLGLLFSGLDVIDVSGAGVTGLCEDFQTSVCQAQEAARMHQEVINNIMGLNALPMSHGDTASGSPQAGGFEPAWNSDYPAAFAQLMQTKSGKDKPIDSNSSTDLTNSTVDFIASEMVEQYLWPNPNCHDDGFGLMPAAFPTWEGGCVDFAWQDQQVAFPGQEGWGDVPVARWHEESGEWVDSDPQVQEMKVPSHVGFGYTLTQWPAQQDEKQEITTIMLHNIPKDYTQGGLIQQLDSLGLAGKFDLVYVPVDRNTHQNMGYAFVNFVDGSATKKGQDLLLSSIMLSKRNKKTPKKCWVSPAHLQGLQKNVEHYQKTSSKPLVYVDGQWTSILPCGGGPC